jgi:DNA-binding NarL/FixJ family response regulator
MAPTRIVLADDHQLVRAGIRSLLQRLHDVHVVAEAGDGAEALRLVATQQPDIVLMDIGMAGLNGLEATERIVQAFPAVRVIILSMHDNKEYVLQAPPATCSRTRRRPSWNWPCARWPAARPISAHPSPNM